MTATTTFEGDDIRTWDPKFAPPRFTQYLSAVAALDRFARDHYGKRVIHLALRWLLDRPGVGIALWGARRPEQLSPVEDVLGWHIDAEGSAEIERIVAEHVGDPVGPEFMAPPLQRPAAP